MSVSDLVADEVGQAAVRKRDIRRPLNDSD